MRLNLLSICLLGMMSALCLGVQAPRARKIAQTHSAASLFNSVLADSVRVFGESLPAGLKLIVA